MVVGTGLWLQTVVIQQKRNKNEIIGILFLMVYFALLIINKDMGDVLWIFLFWNKKGIKLWLNRSDLIVERSKCLFQRKNKDIPMYNGDILILFHVINVILILNRTSFGKRFIE